MTPPQYIQRPDGKVEIIDEDGQVWITTPNAEIIEGGLKPSSSPAVPTNLPMMGIHNLNMEPARDPTKVEAPLAFVKMEQLDASSTAVLAIPASSQTSSGAESKASSKSSNSSKAPKKRRSWGQELPEPTTNLPPRKRAKTDAEKEQRRIERVKRNRQAAHNSRERKRQEHESLEGEVDHLKARNEHLEAELARARQQIAELTGNIVPNSPAITASQSNNSATIRPLLLQSPHHSPYLQTEALFTADQLPLMGTMSQVSNSFTSANSTGTTPVLSNSSDFTSPATEPLPFTPTIDPLNLGQTRQFARLSRQADLQCHPLVQDSMNTLILAMVQWVISLFSNLAQLVGTSPICGLQTNPTTLTLVFLNTLLFSLVSMRTCVSLNLVPALWMNFSSLASSPTRAPVALCANRVLPGRTLPLSKRKYSNSALTGVLRELCSVSTSLGWG